MILVAEDEKVREIELRTAAAIIIQSFWRQIMTRRKWTKMRKGFVELQKRFRKRLHGRENDLWKQLRESEREFEVNSMTF